MSVQADCTGSETLIPGVLRGYRRWRVDADTGRLTGISARVPWDVEHTAKCVKQFTLLSNYTDRVSDEPHDVPVPECTCGIYAYYRPGFMAEDAYGVDAFGVIEASGRALLGERGFRAAHARIVALVLPETARVSGLAATLTAECVALFPDATQLLAEYPPDDVTHLLGHPPLDPVDELMTWATFNVKWTVSFNAIPAQDFTKELLQAFARPIAAPRKKRPPLTTPDERAQHALDTRRTRSTGPATPRYRLDGSRPGRAR